MSGHVLANATIDVLLYDNGARTWVTPEGGEFGNLKPPGQAIVQLLQDEGGFRIVASRRIDNSLLLNQIIYENFHYKAATATFHQWKSETKQVYGLNFPYPDQASIFLESVERSVSAVNAGLTQPPYHSINASNGVYQEPQMYAEPQHHIQLQQQQQQQSQPQRRDIDQESIGSAGHPMAYRGKSSYSSLNGVPPSAGNNQLQQQQQQQRRCSNGSSGSSGQSSSTNIYATSNGNGYHPQTAAPQGPAPVPQSNGVTRIPVPPPAPPPLAPAASASKGAPISSNAPPPPPPPPGNLFKSGGPKAAPSMADEIKAKTNRLRKVSSATDTQASTSAPTPKVSVSGGGSNALMDELARRLEMNKVQANNKADAVSTSSSSGFSSSSVGAATTSDTSDSGATLTSTRRPNGDAPKPWSKTNGITSNNVSTDSPKALRKTNGTDAGVAITTADLERLKVEILAEVTQQINAAKQEILNAILAQR